MSITNCDEFYLKRYEKYIEIVVNKFISKCGGKITDIKEDLFQEAQLALLKWIKKQSSFAFDVSKSFLDINKALYEYAKRDTGVHMDTRKFSSFRKECQIIPLNEEMDASLNLNDIDYAIDVERWKRLLSPKQLKILNLRLRGYGVVEISKILNIPRQIITRTINSFIRRKYNAYFHPEQNPAPAQKRKSKSAAA